MVQVDLAELSKKWYNMGKDGTDISKEDSVLFNNLDPWQKRELRNAYVRGSADSLATIA